MKNNNTLTHPYWIDFSALYQRAEAISHAFKSGNLVFFIGSGASKSYSPSMPTWPELLNNLTAELRISNQFHRNEINKLIESKRYLLAAEAIKQFALCDTNDLDLAFDTAVANILKKRLERSDKNDILHSSILDFSIPILTTNYDLIIETVINEKKIDSYELPAITYADENAAALLLNPTKSHSCYIFKLHGSIDKIQRLIIDEKDYTDFYFLEKWPTSLQLLRHILSTKMVVFVGFSLSDPEIMLILRESTRYSTSYQHIAFLNEDELTTIEIDVLRSTYRVDPILFKKIEHLPLFIMEMRNFYHRDNISIQLKEEKSILSQTSIALRTENELPKTCSSVLFGSFAKYGFLSHPYSDADFLFLTNYKTFTSRINSTKAEEILKRKIDATRMSFTEFERLLNVGDPFASSVLVTGSPIEDIEDRYGILARGFKKKYIYSEVLGNANDRYNMRWIRLCIYRNAELDNFLQACYQWSITIMQLFLIKNYYPIDSLLSISLLGNARFTIHEFCTRVGNIDENFFVTLMRGARGIIKIENIPNIKSLVKTFINILKINHNKDDITFLLPGTFLLTEEPPNILRFYKGIAPLIESLKRGEPLFPLGYGSTETEKSFLKTFLEFKNNNEITIFDALFFFQLHDVIKNKEKEKKLKDKELNVLCNELKNGWWIDQFSQSNF